MAAYVETIGREGEKVLVVDDFMDEPHLLIEQASAMAPFDPEQSLYYPGLRRLITAADSDTDLHVRESLQALAPLVAQVFGVQGFTPTEASFCLVTTPPEKLNPLQRLPHYDHTDPGFFAVLHFLSPTPKGGTSFFRHRKTGFERITAERLPVYDEARKAELLASGPPPLTYFNDSDACFERTAFFEGRYNRLLIYRGSLLHSGHIPADFSFSPDPARGRLTCNIFITAAPPPH